MGHIENKWLEKYEIKGPDFDFVERDYVGMSDVQYAPSRYIKDGENWKSRKRARKLFGKKKARIMVVGDITCFEKCILEAQNGRDYDFSYSFEKLQPIFKKADLVVGNLESMISPCYPYRTEKYVMEENFHCNAPIEFLDAIRKAGIDVLTTANNHDLDTGAIGIGETIDNIERFGFIQTGTFKSDKKHYEIIDVAGFKIAVVAFTIKHNHKEVNLTPEGREFLLNDYTKKKAKKIIENARKEGAELVFTCIHWGSEYKIAPNKEQMRIAEELTDMGYDCIIGSHPHVLQPFTMFKKGEKNVPLFYSMGNFIAHTSNNRKARSIIACIDLERHGAKVEMKCSYIPIIVSESYGDKKYVVLPLSQNPSDSRNAQKLKLTKEILGNEIEINQKIKVKEYIEKKEEKSSVSSKKKIAEPNLSKIDTYPITYDNGKFTYLIYKDYAKFTGISKENTTYVCSMPKNVLKLPVVGVAEGAFEGNKLIKKVNFESHILFISKRVCKDCAALEGVGLGKNVIEIKEEAFADCVNLASVVVKNKTKKIGSKAFCNCENLRSVKIPRNVTEIAEDAFEGCARVVFYCEENSYAEQYAHEHGIKAVHMKLS